MDIKAACSKEYHAVRSSGLRPINAVWWIVIHDEEAPTAESAAQWFQNPRAQGSAHLCIDDTICYRTLDNNEIPWGALSTFGANTHGFHIEQAGYAWWTVAIWKSHRQQMQRVAYKTALHCKLFDIPPYFVKADGLLAGKRGVTTHAEVTKASKKADPGNAWRYNHTDPGLGWPRFFFMRLVRAFYEELSL